LKGFAGPEGEQGFTLVELMIVILIIAILVSIAVISFQFSAQRTRETVCKANLRIIKLAIRNYQSTNDDNLPPSLEALVPDYISDTRSLYCPEVGVHYEYDSETGEVHCPHCEP
jgi:prepilin-type N-terminal cleavage/methylation domain-containing protein